MENPTEFINLHENLQIEKNLGLILINSKINNIDVKLLIDTGSEASLISQNLIKKLNISEKEIIKIPKINLVGANSKKLCEVNKSSIIKIYINEEIVNVQLLIVPNMDTEIIIGSDVLEKNKAIIEYENKRIQINGKWVNFEENEDQETKVINTNMYKVEKEDGEEVESIIIDCNDKWKDKVHELIFKYKNLFTKETRVARNYVHRIEVTKDIKSFKTKTYPIPHKYKDRVQIAISQLIKDKIIERSTTPYINPIVVVVKKDGDLRLCLDARTLNKYSIPQYEAPMSIEAILGRITKTAIFTKIDLRHSFWLIPLHVDSRDFTGFSINGEIFRFCVVPFGVQSACSSLVKALHQILNKYESFVLHYVDDILIFSKNSEEHLEHIKIVFHELDNAGLKVNIKKCQFFKEQVIYLGYQISQMCIDLDPERIKIIQNYNRPNSLKTLRGFLGMLNYFKRLIPDLSLKEIPLIELLKKNVKWKWTPEREQAFQDIKLEFIKNLRIYHPQYELPFILRTDASMQRLAGVLLQKQDIGEVPICFVSRVTKTHERNYSVSELELASIIFAVTKLRFYLLGNKFLIETDNEALTSILRNKFGNNRIHRWALLLQEYDFEIKHISGKLNIVTDSITRMEDSKNTNKNQIKVGVNILKRSTGIFSLAKVQDDQVNLTKIEKQRAQYKDNIYFKIVNTKELYLITKNLALEIIKELHTTLGHPGIRRTWLLFRENYIAKKDITIAKTIINVCKICQLAKDKNMHNLNKPKTIMAEKPLQIAAIDFMSNLIRSPNNNKHILVILDIFSKFIKLYPTSKTNTIKVKECFTQYFIEIGIPEQCIMDNATYFNNDRLKTWLQRSNVQPVYTSIRHPSSNPSERYIKEVSKYLRILVHENHEQWEENLTQIEKFINNTPNTVTEQPPILLMKNIYPERPWVTEVSENYNELLEQVGKRLYKNSERTIKRRMKKIKNPTVFKKGDLVIVKALRVPNKGENKCARLQLPYEGPYLIENEQGVNSYILREQNNGKIRGIFNIEQIYKFYE